MGVKIRKTGKSEILGGKIYSFNPPPPPPRGSSPLYKLHRYVPPHRTSGRVLRRFGLKKGIPFLAHFSLESGMVFEGLRVCMNVFNASIPKE